LQAHPVATYCTHAPDWSSVISISGSITFVDDASLKQKMLELHPNIKDIYKSADNPILKMFYIQVGEVQTFSYKEGAKFYKLEN